MKDAPDPNLPPSKPELHPAEALAKQRAMMLRFVRAAFFVLVLTVTLLGAIRQLDAARAGEGESIHWYIPGILGSLVVFGIALLVDILTPNKKIATITSIVLGVIAGMIATLALGFVIDLVVESWVPTGKGLEAVKPTVNAVKILLGTTLCYLGVSTVLQTQDDFRLIIPYVEFVKQLRGVRPVLLDTSVLIDGRLADVAATGFLQAPMVVHRAVIAELQLLSDSPDTLTRQKGRRGLEMITRLQRLPRIDLTVDDSRAQAKSVDQILVELAREMSAGIMTLDSGLAKVAAISSVPILNLNELANAIKSSLVPGESVTVKLLRAGEQPGQAVGYLPDGTMVVAEDGGGHIGETLSLTVTSSLQTSAGRLIFARANLAPPRQAPVPDVPPPPDDETARVENGSPAPALPAPAEEAPSAGAEHKNDSEAAQRTQPGARGPFPPKPPVSIRGGTPRNPRR
ncbi:MAG: PIN/TRAM domain-containing protein [Tepidisphaera sp.]|nr:PIN/TRAM domain-containing protein [Tepidisphaera sp.]